MGFALAELLVVLAIVALLAAVILPRVVQRVTGGVAAGLVSDLKALNDANAQFHNDMRRYPSQLVHLITAPAATDLDVCGRLLPNPARWRGPYASQTIPATGIERSGSIIVNTLRRVPATSTPPNQPGTLFIDVTGVDSVVAADIERAFDGEALDYASGTILWTVGPEPARGTLSFGVPIRGC